MLLRDEVLRNADEDSVLTAYKCLMHFNGFSNTLLFGVVMWLLLCKTPETMKAYRWFLVNLSVSRIPYNFCTAGRLGKLLRTGHTAYIAHAAVAPLSVTWRLLFRNSCLTWP